MSIALSKLGSLKSLSFRGSSLGRLPPEDFDVWMQGLKDLKHLVQLDLSWNEISPSNIESIIANAPGLIKLEMSVWGFSCEDIIRCLEGLKSLKYFDTGGNGMGYSLNEAQMLEIQARSKHLNRSNY